MSVTLNVVCDAAANAEHKKAGATDADFTWEGHTYYNKYGHCDLVANYKGWEGCALADLNVVLAPL
jgi:hypothetical protein